MQNHYFRIAEHYTTMAKVVELGAPTYIHLADPTR
jgi:hypothetical protein